MIYVTGDTHGDLTRLSNDYLKNLDKQLSEKDYVIVCGDFGLCWSKLDFDYKVKYLSREPFTILWVQGNHENYDMIAEFPVEEWKGGKVRHIVRDKIILLERGQVFEIEGQRIFTFGGAASHDIDGGILDRRDSDFMEQFKAAKETKLPFRILRESWWPEELPGEDELEEGRRNLEKCDYEVDYVITHCASTKMQQVMDPGPGCIFKADILTDYLDEIEQKLLFKHWYYGHYHADFNVDENHSLLYHALIPLGEPTDLSKVPMLGHPRYVLGDIVRFQARGEEKVGEISIVDAYGTSSQNEQPSYDIYVKEDNCLYKHCCESQVTFVRHNTSNNT